MHKIIQAIVISFYIGLSSINAHSNSLNLPDLGDSSGGILGSLDEKKLGQKTMFQARASLPYVVDPELEEYINQLGQRLVVNLEGYQPNFQFFIVDQPIINAFAVPGGYLTFFAGLISATQNEDELVSVIAHEISHVTQKHLARMIARSKANTLPAAAAIIGGILLGGDAGVAAIIGTNAGLIDDQLNYSRTFETEADSIGMQLMSAAGFDVKGMPSFFSTLQKETQLQESAAPEYFRTHPLTQTRISESESRTSSYPKVNRESPREYFLMREKVKALGKQRRPNDVVDEFKARLNSATNTIENDAIKYGYAYSLMNVNQTDEAQKIANELLSSYPSDRYFRNLSAQIHAKKGDYEGATAILEAAFKEYPDSLALKMDLADILVKSEQAKQAIGLLRQITKAQPENAYMFRLLAQAYGADGNLFESNLNLGIYNQLLGRFTQSLSHLESAKNNVGSSDYLKSRVEAKISEVQADRFFFTHD